MAILNRRVPEAARDPANPLLERVKFLAITEYLDEFVECGCRFSAAHRTRSAERSPDGLRRRRARW